MKSIIISIGFLFSVGSLQAQSKLTKENIKKDSIIKVDIIDPAVAEAQGDAPDWSSLTAEITKKYDATYADRTVTKGIIYFTYNRDWPAFTAAIVKYTNKYENPEDLGLLNFNANFILKYSTNQEELKTALDWSKHTVDKEPTNANYKATYTALVTKAGGK